MLQLVIVLLFGTAAHAHDPLVVETSDGKVRGYRMTSRAGRQFLAFAGVPYAKAPLGPLRFQPPAELNNWKGIRNATDHGPWCLQYNHFEITPTSFGTEDCLYLSLYTHKISSRNAVMVHFHGGGFTSGNGARRTQPQFLMDQDVVVVDVNYRVGFLGFLSFEDKEMPGNQGLKDQVMALRWVQKNIAKFGGDPNRVTIVGESAGAGSVYHHTVSPLTKGLFHGAIAESGTSYNSWALAPPGLAKSNSQKLARNLGCPDSSTSAAVSCLLAKNGSEVAAGLESFKVWQIDTTMFWPCLEQEGPGSFLVGPVSKWEHKPVPLMLGTTSAEGLLRTGYFLYYKTDFKWLSDNFDRLAPLSLRYIFSSSNPVEVTRKVREYYFSGGEITAESWFNLTQLYTDSWFTIGILDGANLHPGDTYFYYFDYIGEFTFYIGDQANNRTIFFGAPHTEEINFLWQNPRFNRTLNQEDLEFSTRLVKIWTDFAKFGNPTPIGSDISWRKWSSKKHNYLEMSHDGFQQKEGFAVSRYKFWKSLNYRDNIQ